MSDRHVCPVWLGYLLASPLRRLFEKPYRNLRPHVKQDMEVLDLGCAMGFYALPMAEIVGPEGRVMCVDLQEKMVRKLIGRARKKDLHHRIEARVCRPDDLNLSDMLETFDFALASAVVHEVPDAGLFFDQVSEVLRPNGLLLVLEPRGHVSTEQFDRTVEQASGRGFDLLNRGMKGTRRSALFRKTAE